MRVCAARDIYYLRAPSQKKIEQLRDNETHCRCPVGASAQMRSYLMSSVTRSCDIKLSKCRPPPKEANTFHTHIHSAYSESGLGRPLATKTRFRWYPTFDRMVHSPTYKGQVTVSPLAPIRKNGGYRDRFKTESLYILLHTQHKHMAHRSVSCLYRKDPEHLVSLLPAGKWSFTLRNRIMPHYAQ